GGLAACETTPHYPIDAADARGPAPLTMPRPHYPIDAALSAPNDGRDADSRDAAAAAPTPAAAPAADPAPLAAPVSRVESAPLPPPGPSASADGPRLQYASMRTEGEAAGAAPATTPPATTTAAPVASATSAAPPPAAPPPAAPPPAADPADTALTPRQVIHDQASAAPATPAASYAQPAARREYATLPPSAPASGNGLFITGPVVSASGSVYENYEVQHGEHIDQLARNFSTTRDAILDANHIRAPYVIRPGQIIKVPVTKAYVARSGDTLVGVARRFSVSPSELAQLNRMEMRATLQAGQQIGLPSSMRDRGPQQFETYAEAAPSRAAYTPPRSYTPRSYTPRGYVTQVPSQPTMAPDAGYHAGAAPPPPQAAPTLTDAQIQAAAHGRFIWPVQGSIVRKFGPLGIGQRNDGVDIKAAQGAVVKAAAPGEVVYAGNQVPGFGNLVLIKHADGWVTAYAHLDSISVQMRQQVAQNQVVGSVGMTGGLVEPELHFEVRYAPTTQDKARPVDPALVLPGT
ncbi:MAG TPA: LysM peptidoglycan-binding domain-containing M23 family metallopeptidase, partial [Caulobacteraceae bacterium]